MIKSQEFQHKAPVDTCCILKNMHLLPIIISRPVLTAIVCTVELQQYILFEYHPGAYFYNLKQLLAKEATVQAMVAWLFKIQYYFY